MRRDPLKLRLPPRLVGSNLQRPKGESPAVSPSGLVAGTEKRAVAGATARHQAATHEHGKRLDERHSAPSGAALTAVLVGAEIDHLEIEVEIPDERVPD